MVKISIEVNDAAEAARLVGIIGASEVDVRLKSGATKQVVLVQQPIAPKKTVIHKKHKPKKSAEARPWTSEEQESLIAFYKDPSNRNERGQLEGAKLLAWCKQNKRSLNATRVRLHMSGYGKVKLMPVVTRTEFPSLNSVNVPKHVIEGIFKSLGPSKKTLTMNELATTLNIQTVDQWHSFVLEVSKRHDEIERAIGIKGPIHADKKDGSVWIAIP